MLKSYLKQDNVAPHPLQKMFNFEIHFHRYGMKIKTWK